jgi:hypothetical protein
VTLAARLTRKTAAETISLMPDDLPLVRISTKNEVSGTWSINRMPRGQRPRSRTIAVLLDEVGQPPFLINQRKRRR